MRATYANGYAECAGDSANPSLWHKLQVAVMPVLGRTGTRVRDLSGKKRNASFVGLGTTNWAREGVDQGVDMDATNGEYVKVSSGVQYIRDGVPMTVVVDLTFDAQHSSQFGNIFVVESDQGTNGALNFFLSDNGSYDDVTIRFPGSGAGKAYPLHDPVLGRHVIAIVYDGGTITSADSYTLYDAGKPCPYENDNGVIGVTQETLVGNHGVSGSYNNGMDGRLFGFLIYERALPRSEIQRLTRDITAPFQPRDPTPVIAEAAVPGSFEAAWAAGSSVLVGQGVG